MVSRRLWAVRSTFRCPTCTDASPTCRFPALASAEGAAVEVERSDGTHGVAGALSERVIRRAGGRAIEPEYSTGTPASAAPQPPAAQLQAAVWTAGARDRPALEAFLKEQGVPASDINLFADAMFGPSEQLLPHQVRRCCVHKDLHNLL